MLQLSDNMEWLSVPGHHLMIRMTNGFYEVEIGASGAGGKAMGAQVCSEKQTALVEMSNNSLFMKVNLYASTLAGPILNYVSEQNAMNPYATTGGFIIPTDAIHCGVTTGSAWANELDVGFCFEVHTEKLSLQRIQELLVSLTAN